MEFLLTEKEKVVQKAGLRMNKNSSSGHVEFLSSRKLGKFGNI